MERHFGLTVFVQINHIHGTTSGLLKSICFIKSTAEIKIFSAWYKKIFGWSPLLDFTSMSTEWLESFIFLFLNNYYITAMMLRLAVFTVAI